MANDSNAVFLDTSYVLALINTRDQWHSAASQWEGELAKQRRPIVTTEFVLAEIADGLAAVRFRESAVAAIDSLRSSPLVEIIDASPELFDKALDVYRARDDKDWGLTDCSSFVVMTERDLLEALSTDDHFRQAGFRPLVLSETP